MASGTPLNSFQGMSAETPTSMVELSVSCRNLKDTDVFSKADPMAVLYMLPFGQQKWVEVDRTETIMNTLNPDFAKKFIITYFFEQIQKLKFELYDVDSSSRNLADHDYLGFAEFSLGETVSMCSLTKPVEIQGKKIGTITLRAEELSGCKEEFTFQFMARNLPKGSFFSSAAPFLTLSRVNEDSSFTVIHRTEHPKSTSPVWKTFTLTAQTLCNGDFDRSIKIECHHYKNNGSSHKTLGEFSTNLNQLIKDSTLRSPFYLVNKEKQRSKANYKNSGEVTLVSLQRNPIYTFLDYIQGGSTELLCTIAIDFTASNGDPRKPESLHFMDQYRPNQYCQALFAVGQIIQDYDSDKLFPVLGFGAKLPPDGRVSHEFFVNMDAANPYCAGLDGVINAYRICLNQVQLYGPTNFAPIVNHVARIANTQRDGTKYHILLILTDGVISDMVATKEAIVNASGLPISIIIIGVGNANFEAMEELDGDVVRLQSNGRFAERDIVQFVAFRDFGNELKTTDFATTQAELAKAVLAEVPQQFVSYMKKNGVKPGLKPQQNAPQI